MIVGIILAAGSSSRMGRAKALLPIGPDLFVTRLCQTMASAGIDDTVVVTGAATREIGDALRAAGLQPRVVENPAPERGQLSSLLVGLGLADRPGVEAVLVTLVDVPLVAASTVAAMIEAWRTTHAPLVRPVRAGRHGHPVLFARALFDELRHADAGQGAKAVVRAHAQDGVDVRVDDEGATLDIDTPEDYERLIGSAAGT